LFIIAQKIRGYELLHAAGFLEPALAYNDKTPVDLSRAILDELLAGSGDGLRSPLALKAIRRLMELALLLGLSPEGLFAAVSDNTPASVTQSISLADPDNDDDDEQAAGAMHVDGIRRRFANKNTRGELFSRDVTQPLCEFFARHFDLFAQSLFVHATNSSVRSLIHAVLLAVRTQV
jgi:hypothetical protein